MEESNENVAVMSREEIPGALWNITEKVQRLKFLVDVFRGWDPEIVEAKASSINKLSNCKRNLQDIIRLFETIEEDLICAQKEKEKAKRLILKSQFIMENLPDRFNRPPEIKENHSKINENVSKKTETVKKIPEVLYLTMNEFENVPKYMKGRVTYEKINSFIDVFNKVLSSKYAIFKRKRTTLKKIELDCWNEFNKQELKETKGLLFVVADDFKNLQGYSLDKTSLLMLTILRHCGRIRELRRGGVLRYVAVF